MTKEENDFFTKFLSIDTGPRGQEWELWEHYPSSKTDFMKLFREKLSDTCVKWVNPVALVVYHHPGSIMGKMEISWGQHLEASLFMPVAKEEADQTQLDRAYKDINNPNNEKKEHLTPRFKKIEFLDACCYRCVTKEGQDKIEIYRCKNGVERIEVIERVEHYKNLFELTNPIWFLPSPMLSLNAVRSDLYQDYLVGAYVGIDQSQSCPHGSSEGCTSATWANDPSLRKAIEWATQLFFLRRLKDQGNEFQKVLTQYSKQMHMLRLLETPLAKLSEALDATQEHSQMLRAVLYNPSRTIFSAAPRVMRYFDEGRTIELGQLRWKAVHDPYKAGNECIPDIKLTVAAIICEIFGMMDPMPENQGALISRAIQLLSNSTDLAYDDLKKTCVRITGGTDCFSQNDKVIKAALFFKEILYRPYKDGDTYFPLLPLYVVLYDCGDNFEVVVCIRNKRYSINKLEDALNNVSTSMTNLFDKLPLPVPRYSQWLSFMLGVLAYVKAERRNNVEKATITLVPGKSTHVTIGFSKSGKESVFIDREMLKIYRQMKRWLGNHDVSFMALGNFKKPFIDFVLAAEGKAAVGKNYFSIKHNVYEEKFSLITTIKASGNELCYSVEKIT